MAFKYIVKNGKMIENPNYGKSLTKRFFETVTPKMSKQWDESVEQDRQEFKYCIRPVSLSKELFEKFTENKNIRIDISRGEPYCYEIWANSYGKEDFRLAEITNNNLIDVLSNEFIHFTDIKSLKTNIVVLEVNDILFLYDQDLQICRVIHEIKLGDFKSLNNPQNKTNNLNSIIQFLERESLRITKENNEAKRDANNLPF